MAALALAAPEDLRVTGIKAVCRNGQTFVTWKDAAEGASGSALRYSLYRSDHPITQENLASAELCYSGVVNNSAKLYAGAFTQKSRQDTNSPVFVIWHDGKAAPTPMPTAIIEEGGQPLPMGSGLAVHTVTNDGAAFYAIAATDTNGQQVLSRVEPGQSATTVAVDEKIAPIQPIRLIDSNVHGPYKAVCGITGTKGLALSVSLHASSAQGANAGSHGDYYLYFATPQMGWRDGLPGVFSVEERKPDKDGTGTLILQSRDTLEHPSGDRTLETYWFGYYCTPQWAADRTPRAYPFTENRMMWIVNWVVNKYGVDTQRVYASGQSMGGWGSMSLAYHHPEIFSAIFPTLPRMRQRGLPALVPLKKDEVALMPDGKTPYFDRMDHVRFAAQYPGELPFLCWSIGRHDGFATWKEQVDMVKALTTAHRGFAMAWNDGGHGDGAAAMSRLKANYNRDKFAMNQSYPAFGSSSLDDDLGSGDLAGKELKDGAKEGGINLGFVWTGVVDEDGKWAVTISNGLAKADMTVDVTPRRCQKFKAKPGAEFTWTTSVGGAGKAVADGAGLVTVSKVTIKPGAATTLTIAR